MCSRGFAVVLAVFFAISLVSAIGLQDLFKKTVTGNAIEDSCTDSDGGQNIYSQGKTVSSTSTGSSTSWGDVCASASSGVYQPAVYEGYCNSANQATNILTYCPTGSQCIDGACTQNSSRSVNVTCTSFVYGAWSLCSNGQQNRAVTSSTPSGCTGGSPVTTQSCTTQANITSMPLACGIVGDIDADGKITTLDYNLAGEVVAGNKNVELTRIDVNADGQISASDWVLIGRYVNGLDSTFPACTTINICSDSDGGLNYNIKGFVSSSGQITYDTCIANDQPSSNGTELAEYSCSANGNKVQSPYVCPNGCVNGACIQNTTQGSLCSDSDGGFNVYVAGEAGNSEGGRGDYCDFGSNEKGILYEASCSNGYPVVNMTACPADAPYCNRGACSIQPPICSDSDGGINVHAKGTITEPRLVDGPQHTDYCESLQTLQPWNDCKGELCGIREYSCNTPYATTSYQDIPCPNGCVNGACIQNTTAEVKEVLVTGRLIDELSGNPVKNAKLISAYQFYPTEVMTGSDGSFKFKINTDFVVVEGPEAGKKDNVADYVFYSQGYMYSHISFARNGIHSLEYNVWNEANRQPREMQNISNVQELSIKIPAYPAADLQTDQDIAAGITVQFEVVPGEYNGQGQGSIEKKHYMSNALPLNRDVFIKFFDEDEKEVANSSIYYTPLEARSNIVKLTYENGKSEWEIVKKDNPVECTDGCAYNNKCIPIGTRTEDKQFCSYNGVLGVQVESNGFCSNNFECGSNVCINSQCVDAGLIDRVLNWFKKLFGGDTQPKNDFPATISEYRRVDSVTVEKDCVDLDENTPDNSYNLTGKFCATTKRSQYERTTADDRTGVFVSIWDITEGNDLFEKYMALAAQNATVRAGGKTYTILRLENHELLWFTAQEDPLVVFTQEYNATKDNDGTSYSYGWATGDNDVTRHYIDNFPPVSG